jgi:L-malate glycosyltransferase
VRIALVAHTNAPWTGHYARFLGSRGHTVRVLSFSTDALPGVDVELVRVPSFLPRAAAYVAGVPAVRRGLRRFEPDVVLATYLSSNGLVAALAAGRTPIVASARGGDVLRQAGYLPGGRLHGPLMRFVCRRAVAVHAVSPELVDALVAVGVDRERIECFPVGVDLNAFPQRPQSRESGAPRILCTRKQDAVYGNETLVAALAELASSGRAFTATLVGDGPLLEERRAQVRNLGLESIVQLPGALPLPRIGELLREADVYVSAATSDGTSSSLLEAMASGAFPVVASIRANHDWLSEGETALFFPPGDPHALAAALARALGDPGLRAAAAAANRLRVEQDGNQARTMERLEALLGRAVA